MVLSVSSADRPAQGLSKSIGGHKIKKALSVAHVASRKVTPGLVRPILLAMAPSLEPFMIRERPPPELSAGKDGG